MRKLLATVSVLLLLTACSSTSQSTDSGQNSNTENESSISGVVKTGGSTSVEKVMNALIYQFEEDNSEVTVDYEMNGSGDGIKNTLSGLYEIGHVSRDLKTDGSEDGLKPSSYAIDGIALIAHKNNTVSNMSKEQVFDIYTGQITNWKEVGGADAPITVVSRESGSGTRSAFAEIIGLEKSGDTSTNIVQSANEQNSTGAVQTIVAQNENALGYMSFSDYDAEKVSAINYEAVSISNDTLKDGSYALKREFCLVSKEDVILSPTAQAFYDFVISPEGQEIVAENKLLQVN